MENCKIDAGGGGMLMGDTHVGAPAHSQTATESYGVLGPIVRKIRYDLVKRIEELVYDMNDCLRFEGSNIADNKEYSFKDDNGLYYSYWYYCDQENRWFIKIRTEDLILAFCVKEHELCARINSESGLVEISAMTDDSSLAYMLGVLKAVQRDMESRFPNYW